MTDTDQLPALEPRRARGRPTAEDLIGLEARLVRVARRCFLANGYGATSVNQIAKEARVSKGTLYSRFATKADIFRAIIDDQIQSRGARVSFAGPRPKTLEAMLRTYAEKSLHEALRAETIQLNRLIYSEAARFPELGEAAWARSRVGVQQVGKLIAYYAEKDGIPCADPEAVADTFTTILRGIYGDQMLRGSVVEEAEMIASAHKMVKILLADRHGW